MRSSSVISLQEWQDSINALFPEPIRIASRFPDRGGLRRGAVGVNSHPARYGSFACICVTDVDFDREEWGRPGSFGWRWCGGVGLNSHECIGYGGTL